MSLPSIDFEAIRHDEALLVTLVERYVLGGRTLHRFGRGYRSRGGDAGNAVSVYRSRRDGSWRFHHHKLGEDGDALDVLRLYAGAPTVVDAARMLGALPPAPPRRWRGPPRRSGGAAPEVSEQEPPLPRWATDPAYGAALALSYATHPDAVDAWRAYKPLGVRQIRQAGLGYGVLPQHETVRRDGRRVLVHTARCDHPRLIYPVLKGGVVVAIRGRHAGCPCDPKRTKWLSAYGSRAWLYGVEWVRRDDRVLVCENPIDAMLARRIEPDLVALAPTAGAGTWRPEWTDHLAAVRPWQTIVWYDHDLSGNCGPEHCDACRTEMHAWRTAHPGKIRPSANGLKVAAHLRQAGLARVELYPWSADHDHGADLGDVLAQHLSTQGSVSLLDRTMSNR